MNTLTLVGAPSISKFSKLRAPAWAGTPTLNTLNLVGAPPISKFFKVASAGRCRDTNFENFEVGGGTASLNMFKVEPGPGIRHDTPCRASPVPAQFKCQAAKIGPAVAGQAFGNPRPHGPHGLSVGLFPQQPRVQLGPLGRTSSTLKTLRTQSHREGAQLQR